MSIAQAMCPVLCLLCLCHVSWPIWLMDCFPGLHVCPIDMLIQWLLPYWTRNPDLRNEGTFWGSVWGVWINTCRTFAVCGVGSRATQRVSWEKRTISVLQAGYMEFKDCALLWLMFQKAPFKKALLCRVMQSLTSRSKVKEPHWFTCHDLAITGWHELHVWASIGLFTRNCCSQLF